MSEIRVMLADTVRRLFADGVGTERIVAAEGGAWLGDVWTALERGGLTRPHLPETAGGAGGSWLEAYVIARAAGRHCVPLPVTETMLAGWLLAQAGLAVPDGPLTFAPALQPAGALTPKSFTARLTNVPWGRHARHVVVVAAHGERVRVGRAAVEAAQIDPGHNVALEPRDTLRFEGAPLDDAGEAAVSGRIVEHYGALLRTAQMAGALDAILDMSVQYAGERVQFGRPIAKFQIIQQELARLAGWVAVAGSASEVAFRAADEARPDACGRIGAAGDPTFEIAAAKVVVGDAAEQGPRIAHQVHGAIGFTYEHALHFATRRLWAWRAEFGTPERWAARLGAQVLRGGAAALWPSITAR
jgi:acyl-CoA dehydrogenase